jgi:outer membrane receptor protein involved in Fe transport
MGAEFRNYMLNYQNLQNSPTLTFGTNYTQATSTTEGASPGGVGQGLASFLFGLPTSGSITQTTDISDASPHMSFFVQDDWRLRPNLTINIGLRYEVEGAMSERWNRSVRGFDTTTVNPVNAQVVANYARSPVNEVPVSQFVVKGGLQFAGVNGQPHALYNTPLPSKLAIERLFPR